MALRYREVLSALLWGSALATFFVPFIAERDRMLVAMGIWTLALVIRPNATEPIGPRPSQPIWDERDSGQKFSIAMMHVMFLVIAGFIAWNLMAVGNSAGGAWWYLPLAAAVFVAALWLVWRNWSNRNAR